MNRHFKNLICDLPALQHKRELFATGLIDNPCYPCDFVERQKLREEYARKRSKAVSIVESIRELPSGQSSGWGTRYFGNGHLGYESVEPHSLAFLRVPPIASGKPIEGWNIPPFSFDIFGYAAYPPENILTVAERGEE